MLGTRSLCRRRTVTNSPSAAAHHHTQPPTPRERRAIACSPTVRRRLSHALRLTRSFSPRGLLRTQPSAKPRTSCAALSPPPPASRPPPAVRRPRPCPALRPRNRRPLRSSCRITARNANAWTTLDDTRRPLRPLTSLPRRAATRQSPFNRAPRPLRPAPR